MFDLPQGKMKEVLSNLYQGIQDAYEKRCVKEEEEALCLPSRFSTIQSLVTSLERGKLYTISGCVPKTKKELLYNIVAEVSLKEQMGAVAAFVRKGEVHELVRHMLSLESGVDKQVMKNGLIESEGWRCLAGAVGKLSDLDIYLDDTQPTIAELAVKLYRASKSGATLGLIAVDYLQYAKGEEVLSVGGCRNRDKLKALAEDLDVPVVVTSELYNAVQKPEWFVW